MSTIEAAAPHLTEQEALEHGLEVDAAELVSLHSVLSTQKETDLYEAYKVVDGGDQNRLMTRDEAEDAVLDRAEEWFVDQVRSKVDNADDYIDEVEATLYGEDKQSGAIGALRELANMDREALVKEFASQYDGGEEAVREEMAVFDRNFEKDMMNNDHIDADVKQGALDHARQAAVHMVAAELDGDIDQVLAQVKSQIAAGVEEKVAMNQVLGEFRKKAFEKIEADDSSLINGVTQYDQDAPPALTKNIIKDIYKGEGWGAKQWTDMDVAFLENAQKSAHGQLTHKRMPEHGAQVNRADQDVQDTTTNTPQDTLQTDTPKPKDKQSGMEIEKAKPLRPDVQKTIEVSTARQAELSAEVVKAREAIARMQAESNSGRWFNKNTLENNTEYQVLWGDYTGKLKQLGIEMRKVAVLSGASEEDLELLDSVIVQSTIKEIAEITDKVAEIREENEANAGFFKKGAMATARWMAKHKTVTKFAGVGVMAGATVLTGGLAALPAGAALYTLRQSARSSAVGQTKRVAERIGASKDDLTKVFDALVGAENDESRVDALREAQLAIVASEERQRSRNRAMTAASIVTGLALGGAIRATFEGAPNIAPFGLSSENLMQRLSILDRGPDEFASLGGVAGNILGDIDFVDEASDFSPEAARFATAAGEVDSLGEYVYDVKAGEGVTNVIAARAEELGIEITDEVGPGKMSLQDIYNDIYLPMEEQWYADLHPSETYIYGESEVRLDNTGDLLISSDLNQRMTELLSESAGIELETPTVSAAESINAVDTSDVTANANDLLTQAIDERVEGEVEGTLPIETNADTTSAPAETTVAETAPAIGDRAGATAEAATDRVDLGTLDEYSSTFNEFFATNEGDLAWKNLFYAESLNALPNGIDQEGVVADLRDMLQNPASDVGAALNELRSDFIARAYADNLTVEQAMERGFVGNVATDVQGLIQRRISADSFDLTV